MNRSATAIGIGVLAIAALVGVILFLQLPSSDAPPEQASAPAQTTPAEAASKPAASGNGAIATAPAAPSATTGPGASESMAPQFDVVRVDKKGNVVIAGKAAPDCTVTVRDGDTVVGMATSDRRGDWVIVPGEPLNAGEIQLNLTSKCGDADAQSADRVVVMIVPERPASGTAETVARAVSPGSGQADDKTMASVASGRGSTAEASGSAGTASSGGAPAATSGAAATTGADAQLAARAAAESGRMAKASAGGKNTGGMDSGGAIVVAIPRDASKPGEVMQAPQGVPDGVGVASIDYDDDGKVVITGKAVPNSTVQVYLDNRIVGRADAGADGAWRLVPEVPVAPGKYTLRADMVTRDGTVLARSEIPFVRGEPLADLPAGRIVVIQPGDYLWKIARASYGSGTRYTLIYDANRAQIGDPDLIYPGQVFTLPRVN